MTDEKTGYAQATSVLVDSAAGVYAWHQLVRRYPLYVLDGPHAIPLDTWMRFRSDFHQETLDTVFNPDNPEWCENVNYLDTTECLAVDYNGTWWRVEAHDGDILAVHPNAHWDDEAGEFRYDTEAAHA